MAKAKAKSLKGGKVGKPDCPMGFHPKTRRAVRSKKVNEHHAPKPPKVTITDPITGAERRAVLTGKSDDGTFVYRERNLTTGKTIKPPSTISDPDRVRTILFGPLPPSPIKQG